MSNLSFIGLGVMGHSMAGHLLSAKHSLTLHTRTKSKADPLLKKGAAWAATPAAAAKNADVIFLCLPDTPDVEAVILGKKGLIESAKPDTIIVDHSTIAPGATQKIADELAKKKIHFLDAPISGGDVGARNATLSIMVGGDKKTFDNALPLLRHMGKTITHCGPVGAGQLTKLVNQILVTVTNLAVCEALTFARKNKLDLPKTIEAIGGGAASSWQLLNLGPRMISGDMRPGFSIDLQQKDLRLVQEAAEFSKTSLPATSLVHQLFTAAQAAGHGKDGTQALFTVVEKLASLH